MLPALTAVECVNASVYPRLLKFFRFRQRKTSSIPVMQLFLHAWSQAHAEQYYSIMRVVTVLPEHKQNVLRLQSTYSTVQTFTHWDYIPLKLACRYYIRLSFSEIVRSLRLLGTYSMVVPRGL